MARRKTWNEKLHAPHDLPKVVQISGSMSKKWGAGTCVVPSPLEVNHFMRQVRKGRLVTVNELREALATYHQTDLACPLTTGIFCWIAAHAAEEAIEQGQSRTTPWWRTLKSGGELNPKFPGGYERQRALLESEGHLVIQRGKRMFVDDFEHKLAKLNPETLTDMPSAAYAH